MKQNTENELVEEINRLVDKMEEARRSGKDSDIKPVLARLETVLKQLTALRRKK